MDTTYSKLIAVAAFLAAAAGIIIGAADMRQIASLQGQVGALQSSLTLQASSTRALSASEQALATKEAAASKTQNQSLTSAVAAAEPAVVSVVISQDVPQLQVVYENPFGNDPAFQGFGMEIPVYQQTGSSLQEVGAGSGFLISHDGYILTNKHVVSDTDAEYTVLLSNGRQETAQVVYRDPNNDIAVIKIPGTYATIASFGDSSSLELGQTVAAIGNALGQYSNSVSVGVISGLDRTIQATDENGSTESLTGVLQTDASINPGNSGGPLIDLNGDVIGINVATVTNGSNISFAIPVNTVKSVIAPYLQ